MGEWKNGRGRRPHERKMDKQWDGGGGWWRRMGRRMGRRKWWWKQKRVVGGTDKMDKDRHGGTAFNSSRKGKVWQMSVSLLLA